MYRTIKATLVILGILFVLGCSRAGYITSPDSGSMNQLSQYDSIPILADTFDDDGNPIGGTGVMGIYSVHVNPLQGNAELVPLRQSSLDDALEMVDITNFLNLAPCSDCAKLFGIELDLSGNVVLNIGIKHPFGVGDPYKPITGKNRADLHVFNVEGTVIFADSPNGHNFPGLSMSTSPSYLRNADGYSRYLDIAIDDIYPTAAKLHPYVLHFDDYSSGNFSPTNAMGFESVTTPLPSGNLVMPMGSDYDVKPYQFGISDESFDFIFAVGCTYAVSSASKSMRFTPEFQIPQHNKKAASEVAVEIVTNGLQAGNTSSTCELLIKVLDMNHGVAVGTNLDEMLAESSVSGISLEVPGVTSGIVTGSATPISGDGRDPSNPLTFPLTFANDQGAPTGTYAALIKVTDSYSTGQNTSPLLNGQDAIKRVDPLANPLTGLYALTEFATYMLFDVEIGEESHAPVASFTTTPTGTPNLDFRFLDYVYITFKSTSVDPDDPMTPEGQIVKYEWDFVWDGIEANFVDDTAGMGTDEESWEVDRGGTWFTGLRVTDGATPPLTSEIYSIEVTVDPWSRDFVLSTSDARIPKIAEISNGKILCAWSGPSAQTQYSIFEDSYTDPNDAWSSPGQVSPGIANYLSVYPGPNDDECWLSGDINIGGYIKFYRFDGTSWAATASQGVIGCIQTYIYCDDFGGYGIFSNSIASFGFVIRCHYPDIYATFHSTVLEYIYGIPSGNNRLLGQSRIIDKNSEGTVFLSFNQDFAIDPYRPPQDMRYVHIARMGQITPCAQTYTIIDQGTQDTLDSIVLAVDTNDNVHTAYLSQPNGGGNFSIIYKKSSDGAVTFPTQSTVWNGALEPEGEFISIDTDPNNRVMVTYHVDKKIYFATSPDGSTWSTPEIVNTTWPGGQTLDKEQFMQVDGKGRTHVVWDRCPTGTTGYGPIMHKARAPIH